MAAVLIEAQYIRGSGYSSDYLFSFIIVSSVEMAQRYKERLLQGSGYSNKRFESEFGMKILKKFGWREGKGLGKSEEGITDCVQIKRRD